MAAVKYWFRIAASAAMALCWASASAAAADTGARDALSQLLEGLEHYVADFSQEIRGARGQVLERSTGQLVLARPCFKWVVNHPYPQVIVTDGAELKVYDPDLEQLTIRPLDTALADTPVSILTQGAVVLGDNFEVARGDDDTTGTVFVLTPSSVDTLFAEIRLRFAGGSLVSLGIVDHLGQFTEILFTPLGEPGVIQSAEFELSVPPGTDVIQG